MALTTGFIPETNHNRQPQMNDEYLWVEKYRPTTLSEVILPSDLHQSLTEMVSKGEAQNLLMSGPAGCGKTTVAKAICGDLDTDFMMVNCSEEGNIDTLRTKIRNFASSVSLSGSKKIVILDEFDYSNAQSTQPALRGFIEEFSHNCRFILTCNFKNKIIAPIHSRCTCIHFSFSKRQLAEMCAMFMKRTAAILHAEGIKYDKDVLAKLIIKHAPDFRRLLNELQRYSVAGSIDVGILSEVGDYNTKTLMKHMKSKDFKEMRKWVVDNIDNDSDRIFRSIYEEMSETLQPQSVPAAILIIAEYQYKSAFVADPEINLTACLVQMMMECSFK